MKKEIIVCDICCKDKDLEVDEFVEATGKCELCGKDVCDDCNYDITFGDEDNETKILSFKCCEDCEGETKLDEKEDEKVVKEVRNILLNHFKKRVLAKNLK